MFLISPVLLSAFFIVCINYWRYEFIKSVYIILMITGIITSLFVIVFYPFSFEEQIYKFEIGRWSHVVYGRFIGSVFLVYLLTNLFRSSSYSSTKSVRRFFNHKYTVVFLIILFGFTVYYTGLRFSLLTLTGIVCALFVFLILKRQINSEKFIFLLTAALVLAVPFFTFEHPDPYQTERYENVNFEKISGDTPMAVRMELLEKGFHMFKQNPVFGIGFGGFKNNVFGESPFFQNYPHNIIIEISVELGIVGLLLFLTVLILTLKVSWRCYPVIFFFILYPLSLSMMSKDISSNVLLWVPVLFVLWGNNRDFKNYFSSV